ncbi:MAG: Fic family protein [Elusimicrobia bacterium]|nr:Fic family protein [Elusimicrobiota bacterium]
MTNVEPPPSISQIIPKTDFARLAAFEEIQQVVARSNEKYLYWDSFKYQPLPVGVSHEEVWAYLKLIRNANSKFLPLADKTGKPFSYWIPDILFKHLNEVDRGSGTIISLDQPEMPDRERYVISSFMEEAIASSQLEGAATTRKVAKEMLRSGRKPFNRSEQMILNNWATMRYLRENQSMRLTPDNIREIHSIVTYKTLDDSAMSGQFRKQDDIVVENNGVTIHVPPKSGTLQDRIKALCAFANEDKPWIHPVVKAAILHFCIGYDHPFVDGNGRTARAVFYWYLLSRRYWIFEYLSISRYFLRAPAQYWRAYIYSEQDGGDLTYFLKFNLRAVRFALHDVRQYIIKKQKETVDSNLLLGNYPGLNSRQKTLIYHALKHPGAQYTIQNHKNTHATAYDTARHDLFGLEKMGLLKKQKQGKAFVFVASEKMTEFRLVP